MFNRLPYEVRRSPLMASPEAVVERKGGKGELGGKCYRRNMPDIQRINT